MKMKTIIYNCDICGRELDIYTTDICTVKGDRNRKHLNHSFEMHLCKWCYEDLFNNSIYPKVNEEKKKYMRRAY